MIYACENVRINNLEDIIKIEPLALFNKTGELDFYNVTNPKFSTIYNLSGEHNLTESKNKLKYAKVKTNGIKLDTYLKDIDLDRIDLLKIDTEGSEYLILQGAGKVLKKDRPIVICETLFNLIEEKLESIFIELDYEFYNHSENGLVKVTSIHRKEDNGVRNCFFVPKEKASLIKEFRFSN